MDPGVNTVIQRIVDTIKPKSVLLFGSHATGNPRKGSDLDILLIYDGPHSKREIQIAVHRLFPHPEFPMDVFVLTSEEFDKLRPIANTLAREVSERGIVCYG